MRFLAWLGVGTLVAALMGCATAPSNGQGAIASAPASQQLLARASVQYAVGKFIVKEKTPEAQQARIDRLRKITGVAIDLVDSGMATTIPAIEDAVRASIDWTKFDLPDRILIDNLIAVVRLELEARIKPGGDNASALDSTLLLDVREVLGWINQAAALAVPNG